MTKNNTFNIPDKVLQDLLSVLRCADADLDGIQRRYDMDVFTSEDDFAAATETRKEIAEIYEVLTGTEFRS